jgi:hypothetical protein
MAKMKKILLPNHSSQHFAKNFQSAKFYTNELYKNILQQEHETRYIILLIYIISAKKLNCLA